MSIAKVTRLLLVAGLLLLLIGIAWPYVLPSGVVYSNAQATELSEASEALHETMHAHDHAHDHDHFGKMHDDHNPEVAAAAKRYREAQEELDSAKFWTSAMPVYLRWSGLAVCALGIAAFVSGRRG
jgi:hypothetical protein